MTDTDQTNDATAGEWVLLEIFGHRRHFGLLTEIERFGAKFARIDEYAPDEDQPFRTHVYSGGAIFSVTPVTEDTARNQAWFSFIPRAVAALPSIDDDDEPF